jgi:beta-glucosidase
VGQLPAYYNHKPSLERSYVLADSKPLFPFGYGLSYTTFRFANLRVDPASIGTGGSVTVSVDVTNTGAREGDEVPQLYIHERVSPLTQPVMQLKGFQRISLKPGEKQTVEFKLTSDMLSTLNLEMRRVVEPGTFDIMVGPSSAQTTSVPLEVVAK